MPALSRYPQTSALAQFLDAPDLIYGTGADGDAVLDGTTTVLGMSPNVVTLTYEMSRDMFFNNLTLNAGVTLQPNGYRVFCKGTLVLGLASRIGFLSGYSTDGSIKQGGDIDTAVTHSLGGSSLTQTATPPTAALGGSQYFTIPRNAITGYSITASGGPTFLRGGAGGVATKGGGVVIVAARYVSVDVAATISAPATLPAGGGVVIVVSSSPQPALLTLDVSGQIFGTAIYSQLV